MAGEHFDAGAQLGLRCTVARNAIGRAVRDVVSTLCKNPLQLFGQPANTRLLGTHNGGQPVKLLRLLDKELHSLQVLGTLGIFVVSDHLKELRFFTAALNGACLATLFFA